MANTSNRNYPLIDPSQVAQIDASNLAVQTIDGDVQGVDARLIAVENALPGKAPLESPAFTGTPTVPTAPAGTNDTQAASTRYADRAVGIESTRAQSAEQANAAAIANEAALRATSDSMLDGRITALENAPVGGSETVLFEGSSTEVNISYSMVESGGNGVLRVLEIIASVLTYEGETIFGVIQYPVGNGNDSVYRPHTYYAQTEGSRGLAAGAIALEIYDNGGYGFLITVPQYNHGGIPQFNGRIYRVSVR